MSLLHCPTEPGGGLGVLSVAATARPNLSLEKNPQTTGPGWACWGRGLSVPVGSWLVCSCLFVGVSIIFNYVFCVFPSFFQIRVDLKV